MQNSKNSEMTVPINLIGDFFNLLEIDKTLFNISI